MLNLSYDIARNDKIAVELNNATLKQEVAELKDLVGSLQKLNLSLKEKYGVVPKKQLD